MQTQSTDTHELADYLRPLRAHWWLIVLIALIASGLAFKHASGQPTRYTSSTELYLSGSSPLDGLLGSSGGEPDRNARNQAVLVLTPPVAQQAARELKFRGNPLSLLGNVDASSSDGTDFLQISATTQNPVDSMRLANAFANAYVKTRAEKARQQVQTAVKSAQSRLKGLGPGADRSALQAQIDRLQSFESLPTNFAQQTRPANLGVAESSSVIRSVLFALALGLVLGCAVAFGLEALDRRLKSVPEIEKAYGQDVLVSLPHKGNALEFGQARLQPPLTEGFRSLRTTLDLYSSGSTSYDFVGRDGARTILVTSAVPGEGKTTVAWNLALAFVEAGRRVALIDADLRNPCLTRGLGLREVGGLNEVLSGQGPASAYARSLPVQSEGLDTLARARHSSMVNRQISYQQVAGGGTATLAPTHTANGNGNGNGNHASQPGLTVLGTTRPEVDPGALLLAGDFQSILDQFRVHHDVVIVDSSPLLAVSDGASLLSQVDGVLVVSRVNYTRRKTADDLQALLARVPSTNVLGVVANAVRDKADAYTYSTAYRR
jgi:succinoglycan biosynthesis transport protein ExoP